MGNSTREPTYGIHLLKLTHLPFTSPECFSGTATGDPLRDLACSGGDTAKIDHVKRSGGKGSHHSTYPTVDDEGVANEGHEVFPRRPRGIAPA